MKDVLLERLVDFEVKDIDYVITNHAEQDHSGTLPAVLQKYPNARVICTPKCKTMLRDCFASLRIKS